MTLIKQEDAIKAVCNAQCELDVPHYPQCDQLKYCEDIQALLALPSAELPKGELISRADALMELNGVCSNWQDDAKVADIIHALPSAEAEPMTEEVREALMRLTMCAREECVICKYKDKCNFDFQYEESTKNMNTILDSLMRSKCEVDAKWIPCSERLPSEDGCYLVSTTGTNNDIIDIAYYTEEIWHKASRIKAWMPLPKPYREDGE